MNSNPQTLKWEGDSNQTARPWKQLYVHCTILKDTQDNLILTETEVWPSDLPKNLMGLGKNVMIRGWEIKEWEESFQEALALELKI